MKKHPFPKRHLSITDFLLCGVAMLISCAATADNLSKVKPELVVERLSWGVHLSSVNQARKIGTAAYVQQQLNASGSPALPRAVQDQIDAMTISQKSLADIVIDLEQLRQSTDDDAKKKVQQEMTRLAKEAQGRAILRALYSPQQLQEQLSWFWFNHFNVFQGKAFLRAMVGDYEEQAIRPHVLGKFRDLLSATARHPAMLRYLDNVQNAVNKPNENYAREIMELHTMGVDSGYTQRDVQELARILTGVGFNLKKEDRPRLERFQNQYVRNGLFEFHPRRHDYGEKQFLGHAIQGSGLAELDEAIDILARHPATAHFISNKLALFFVSDTPSPALVDTMTKTFLATDGDIKAVLTTLFSSTEFSNSLGKKFKDPQHYVFSAMRLAYDNKPILNTQPVINWLARLGQPRYGKLTPDGYALTATAWDSPAQMTARFEVAKIIGSGRADLFDGDAPVMPDLNNALFSEFIFKTLGPNTKKALEQANNPEEWNTLLLAAPEMMYR